MIFALKRLFLGIALIGISSLILLVSDLPGKKKGGYRNGMGKQDSKVLPKIAILKFSSRQVLDETVDGIIKALEANGFKNGKDIEIKILNPEGDLPTANSMAKSIVDGNYRMVITASTPMLQMMAAANKEGKVVHVFGTVTDPFESGVGINRTDSFNRPKNLAGVGTFQPVKEIFRLAKKCNPNLRKVGVVWCSSETCSEACIRLAREVCKDELDIELIEATVDNSNAVLEAAVSLVSRGAEALWIGGDNVVETASSSVIKAANDGRIPVFANTPVQAEKGALIGLGADYYEVGMETGKMAAEILKGKSPNSFPVKNYVPEKLVLNLNVIAKLSQKWNFPDDVLKSAAITVSNKSAENKKAPMSSQSGIVKRSDGRKWKLFFVNYNNVSHVEEAIAGFNDEIQSLGLKEGVDFDIKFANAQGDLPSLLSIMDKIKGDNPDIVLLTSTPALQAAVSKVLPSTIIFGNVADAVVAGAGKTLENHMPNITGITTTSDFKGMISMIKKYFPSTKTIGTLYVPDEINSELYKKKFEEEALKSGIQIKCMPISSSTETGNAAAALIEKRIDIICQISDNMTDAGFSGIVQAGRTAKVPVFAFVGQKVESGGAAVAVARDHAQVGHDMASLTLRIMKGENPSNIPFVPVSRTYTAVNRANAKLFGLQLPEELIKSADKKFGE